MKQAIKSPPAIPRHIGDRALAIHNKLPQVSRRAHVPGITAGHADDRNGLASFHIINLIDFRHQGTQFG
jgi:hypothetical protein